MSDGGEGFTEAVAAALGATVREVPTVDALGRPVRAGIAVAGDLAVLEMAAACGLERIEADERDVMACDTRGVGRMIRAALDAGAHRLVVGIGGSATNDGGAGMLAELGARYLDKDGEEIGATPAELRRLDRVDLDGLDPRVADLAIEVACDVDNPLLGESGASAVFGPQKGANPDEVAELDAVLSQWASALGRMEDAARPGAGAAGGLGFALLSVLGATLSHGVDLVARVVGLADAVAGADLVLTGEGSVDAQTLSGKTPAGVVAVAKAAGVPAVILAGRVARDAGVLLDAGITALVPIVHEPAPLPEVLARGAENLERATATVLRLWASVPGH